MGKLSIVLLLEAMAVDEPSGCWMLASGNYDSILSLFGGRYSAVIDDHVDRRIANVSMS